VSGRWRLEARRPSGEQVASVHHPSTEAELRALAETMATVRGQMCWGYDLYDGGTLKAAYKRGAWKEHGEGKT
jgi:hypothetical protein